jgi:hypothetical protein
MGMFSAGHMNGLMKSQLKWLSSSIKVVQRGIFIKKFTETVTLEPLESYGTSVVKIVKSSGSTYYGDSYYLEFRMPILFDDTTPLPPSGGVLVYSNGYQTGAMQDTYLMDVHPLAKFDGYNSIKTARMVAGDVFDDTINKIKVTVVSIQKNTSGVMNAQVKIEMY